MKKGIFYALLLFLVAIITLLPWADGILFKQKYFHLVDLINRDNHIKVDVLEYERGWLHSYARIRVTSLHHGLFQPTQIPFATSIEPISFTIKQNISHGPIVYNNILKKVQLGYANIQSAFHISKQFDTSLLGHQKDEGIMLINALANFDGDWHGQVFVPKLIMSDLSTRKITWDGLYGKCKIIIHQDILKHIKIEIGVGTLILEDSKTQNKIITKINIQPITYKYDAVHEQAGMWSGDSSLNSASISVLLPDNSSYLANDINVSSTFSATPETFYNINLTINIKTLKTPSQIVSEFSNLKVMLSGKYFSTRSLIDFITAIKSKNQNKIEILSAKTLEILLVHAIVPATNFNSEISATSTLGKFLIRANTILQPRASVLNTINDVLANSKSQIDLEVSPNILTKIIELYGDKLMAAGSETKPNNSDPAPHVTPTTPTIPISAMDQTQQLISDMLRVGYITKENNQFITTLTIEQGILKINGKAPIRPINPQIFPAPTTNAPTQN